MHFTILAGWLEIHLSTAAGRLISGHDTAKDSDFTTIRDTIGNNDSLRVHSAVLVSNSFKMINPHSVVFTSSHPFYF